MKIIFEIYKFKKNKTEKSEDMFMRGKEEIPPELVVSIRYFTR